MIFRIILVCISGCSAGILVSAGLFAFIVMIGVINRLMASTDTGTFSKLYEDMICMGAIAGSAIYVFNIKLPLHGAGMVMYGLFCGIHTGGLSVSLAEMIKVVPIMEKRFNQKIKLSLFITVFAIAKAIGSVIFLW